MKSESPLLTWSVLLDQPNQCSCLPAARAERCAFVPETGVGLLLVQFHVSTVPPRPPAPAGSASSNQIVSLLASADVVADVSVVGFVVVAVAAEVPAELKNRLGIAIGGRAYRAYRELLDSDRWMRLANQGARAQRLLWASTGTKDPEASDTLYIEAFASPFTVNTMPEPTLKAFADHGEVGDLFPPDGGNSEAVLKEFDQAGIDVVALAARLQKEGKESFNKSWEELLKSISAQQGAVAG